MSVFTNTAVFPNTWAKSCPVTIKASQVAGTSLSNFPARMTPTSLMFTDSLSASIDAVQTSITLTSGVRVQNASKIKFADTGEECYVQAGGGTANLTVIRGLGTPANVLPNPGFETGAITGAGGTTAWSVSLSNGATYSITNSTAHTGRYSLQGNASSSGIVDVSSQQFPAVPNQRYTVGVWLSGGAGNNATVSLKIYYYNSTGGQLGTDTPSSFTNLPTTWTYMYGSSLSPAPANTAYVVYHVVISWASGSAVGPAYIDDVYAYTGNAFATTHSIATTVYGGAYDMLTLNANQVTNAGFETGNTSEWTILSSGGGTFSATSAKAHTGTYSATLGPSSPPLGSTVDVYQTAPILPGQVVTGSAWIYGDSTSNPLQCILIASFFDVTGKKLGQSNFCGYNEPGPSWTFISGTSTPAPAGTATVNMYLHLAAFGSGSTGNIYIDDTYFYIGCAAQADGGDVRFSLDPAGQYLLAHEMAAWAQNATPSSATADIWVNVPNVSGYQDTLIYVWWGIGPNFFSAVEQTSLANNRLVNANLVNGLTGWISNGGSMSQNNSIGYPAPPSIELSGVQAGATQFIYGIIPGQQYYLSCDVMTDSGTTGIAVLYFDFWDSIGNIIATGESAILTAPITGGTLSSVVTSPVPVNAYRMRVVYCVLQPPASGNWYITNMQCCQLVFDPAYYVVLHYDKNLNNSGLLQTAATGVNTPDLSTYSQVGLNGSSYVTIPTNTLWDFAGDFTLDCWVNFTSIQPNFWQNAFFAHDNGTGTTNKWIFSYNNAGYLYFYMATGATSATEQSNAWTPTLGTWYHVAVTRQSGLFTFYVNGVNKGGGSNSFVLQPVTQPLGIGWSEAATTLNGLIGESRLSVSLARSASWLLTQYRGQISGGGNLVNPGTPYSPGQFATQTKTK